MTMLPARTVRLTRDGATVTVIIDRQGSRTGLVRGGRGATDHAGQQSGDAGSV